MYKLKEIFCCFALILGLAFIVTGRTTLFYFPDPHRPGQLIPAYLDGGPLTSPLHGNETDIKFYLLTSQHPETPTQISIQDLENMKNTLERVGSAPLKVMIHGFAGTYTDPFPKNTAREYLKLAQEANLVMVDWSPLAAPPWYNVAVRSCKTVGERVAALIQSLVDEGYTTLEETHIIGFSLGAHVAGIAGHALEGKVARITGLDPALPLFENTAPEGRLDPTDAQFVDVIHTASGHFWEGGLSFYVPIGHADFYPNSGKSQPGCESERFSACSHGRAHDYFKESITSDVGFFGCACKDWKDFSSGSCNCVPKYIMGSRVPNEAKGMFWLKTNPASPFALGEKGTEPIAF